jgi:hypothetical protein
MGLEVVCCDLSYSSPVRFITASYADNLYTVLHGQLRTSYHKFKGGAMSIILNEQQLQSKIEQFLTRKHVDTYRAYGFGRRPNIFKYQA